MTKRVLFSLTAFAMAATCAWASGAVSVSPGSQDRFLGAASACPTFSWTRAPGAEGYELVVYSVPASEGDSSGLAAPALESAPVIRATVPAGALSWTPAADSCLELGGSYAWSVRDLGKAGARAHRTRCRSSWPLRSSTAIP